ncbi:hypothetical protein SBOR_1776 [Sclerotinia borealis F-4128]|uniref:Uncharacterized protein n=1 Tax=Sclerotinia borealis (strain F-4128) TaxID=1432307 RepID=W9CPS8_SCLBF|nr:hypothetical protein SBOR_1776 [Sclerotinia borealis F-4128]
MEGERNNKRNAMIPRPGLDPDIPLPSIERNDSGLPENSTTPIPPNRQRLQQRGGLIGSRQHRTSTTSQIPPELLRERRGSDAAYAASLSHLLGPINPRGHQQLAPARTPSQGQPPGSHPQTVGSSGRPMSRYINTRVPDLLPGAPPLFSRQHASSSQLPERNTTSRGGLEAYRSSLNPRNTQQQPSSFVETASRSDSAPVSAPNLQYSGPVIYNPLKIAFGPNNAISYAAEAPHNTRERFQSKSNVFTPGREPYLSQPSSHQPFIQTHNDSGGARDTSTASQVLGSTATGPGSTAQDSFGDLVPAARKRGRPQGSKTNNTKLRRMEPPPPRTALPGSATRTPLPSSSVPVPLSQQPAVARSSRHVTFSLAKNASVMLNPFSKIVSATVKLIADNGQVWEYKYPGIRRNWKKGPSGKATVAKLNDWTNSILRRRLPDNFPAAARKTSNSTPPKPKADKWTEWERAFLEAHIMDAVREKKGNLDAEDWKVVADAQNDEFLDYKRLPGLPLAQLISRTFTIDNIPVVRGGGFTKIEGYFPERSSSEIQSILYSWPDIQEKIKEEVKKNRGKVPAFLDCDTDISDSETSSDDESGTKDTIIVDTGRKVLSPEK